MNTDPQTDLSLQAEPGHLIRRAHQLAVSTFHDTHGRQITPVQFAVLRALQDDPGIDQVTLAEKVALDTSTTADIAARLDREQRNRDYEQLIVVAGAPFRGLVRAELSAETQARVVHEVPKDLVHSPVEVLCEHLPTTAQELKSA